MSPSDQNTASDGLNNVSLQIEAPDLETEIFVIDGKFRLQARGIGRLRAELQPGIYKVKCRTGAVTDEQFVMLRDEPKVIHLARLSFSSPVPLSDTSKTHEYHMAAAERESARVHVKAGDGSWIFVFARDWTGTGATPISWNPAAGLTLEDESGKKIADLSADGVANLSADACSACNIQVNPGTYRLKLELPKLKGETQGSLEQVITASPGWQTQIFFLQRAYGPEPTDRRADLGGAAALLSNGLGFDPKRADFRQIELARLGLANRRQVVSQDVRQMLAMKVENPMLGILGAHLLLLDSEPDESLFKIVVQNLRNILGQPHPDVEALALHFEHPGRYMFQSPPMLRKSWSMIVNATADQPDLIAPGSLANQIWDRLWGADTWLIWRVPNEVATGMGTSRSAGTTESDMRTVEALMQTLIPASAPINKPAKSPFAAVTNMQFVPKPKAPTAEVAAAQQSPALEGMAAHLQSVLDDKRIKTLVRSLGIPHSNLKEVLTNLAAKMGASLRELDRK